MRTRNPQPPNPGDPITSQFLAALAEACGLATGGGVAAPLSMQKTGAGTLVGYGGPVFGAYLGVTTSTITARSGGTLGSGTVKVQAINGTTTKTAADLAGPIAITAYNWNTAAGGVASGKNCVLLKISGAYFVLVAEC